MYSGNVVAVLERGIKAIRQSAWVVILAGFFEPVLYLLSMGLGLGTLVGEVEFRGRAVPYAAYIAPALMAVSAMNGAVYDSTMNVFAKLKHTKLYEQMLATSLGPLDVALGEIALAMFRGLLYAAGFMVVTTVLGLNLSWWAVLAVPAALLIAFGFASIGLSVTSYFSTYQQLGIISVVLLPMFLLSGTFFPLDVYPPALQWAVQALPLWHGTDMIRQLTTGVVDFSVLWHVAYFAVMSLIGCLWAPARLKRLFLR
ncbi:ABC transporter [Tessaracoccus sp. OH4464_COT-324]|nr:ABC transporter [Tessaracoccus sp. OH4464_COT-324]